MKNKKDIVIKLLKYLDENSGKKLLVLRPLDDGIYRTIRGYVIVNR